jgi:hypothetical protein
MGDRKILTITFSLSDKDESSNTNIADMFDQQNSEKIGDRYKKVNDTLEQSNKLLNDGKKLLPIKYQIIDHVKVDGDTYNSGLFQCVNYLADDTFGTFTTDLAKHLSALSKILPHVSKDYSKSQDTKTELLRKTRDSQQMVLTSVVSTKDNTNEFKTLTESLASGEAVIGQLEIIKDDVFGWDIGKKRQKNGEIVDNYQIDEKKIIRKLYDQTQSDGTLNKYEGFFKEGILLQESAQNIIKKVLDEEEIVGDDREESKLEGYLTGSRLLGVYKHNIYNRGNFVDRLLFITKDNILTDGFKIFPIKINQNPVSFDKPYIKEENGVIKIDMPSSYYGIIFGVSSITEQSGGLNWVKNHYESKVHDIETDGTYNAGGGMNSVIYGGNKTSSQRPSKKRSTRRIRK